MLCLSGFELYSRWVPLILSCYVLSTVRPIVHSSPPPPPRMQIYITSSSSIARWAGILHTLISNASVTTSRDHVCLCNSGRIIGLLPIHRQGQVQLTDVVDAYYIVISFLKMVKQLEGIDRKLCELENSTSSLVDFTIRMLCFHFSLIK